MSVVPWSNRPKVDELSPTDTFMRRVPTNIAALNQEITYSDITASMQGSSTVLVASEDDLPPVIDGFRTLEFDKNYLFTEPGIYLDNILFPADWTGWVKKSFFNSNSIIFLGTDAMFTTLEIDGIIDSIADSVTSPGVKSTFTTSVAHGILNGQFVNITDTNIETGYTQQSLQVSNVTEFTFDVEIVFTATDTGLFNTGFGSIQFTEFGLVGNGFNDGIVIQSAGVVGSSLAFTRFAAAGFFVCCIVHNGVNVVTHDSIFAYTGSAGLILNDCIAAALATTEFIALSIGGDIASLEIIGDATKRIGTFNVSFTLISTGSHAVKVDSAITNADELLFQNSPDNNVATDYFATVGLDETDPQVIAINNGIRKNSQTVGSAFVNANTSSTIIVTADTFQDINFGTLIPSADIERVELVDVGNGEFIYIGLRPRSSALVMSISIKKLSGATEFYDIKFVVDKGLGFVDFTDNVILPFEVKTTASRGTYQGRTQLVTGDRIKPQISGIGTTDPIVADSASFDF